MPIESDNELENTFSRSYEDDSDTEEYTKRLDITKESFESILKQRNILLFTTSFLFILLMIFLLLAKIKPEMFISKSNLESKGLVMVDKLDLEDAKMESNSLMEDSKELKQEEVEETFEEDIFEEDTYTDTSSNDNQESIKGTLIYAVQIGAFTDEEIVLYSDSFIQFREFQEAEFYKYSLGAFETLEEAQYFRKKVVGIGFEDAFVASYKNGQRVNIEEAF